MASVTIEVDLPADLARFRLPDAVAARLQDLLDRYRDGLLRVVLCKEILSDDAKFVVAPVGDAEGLISHSLSSDGPGR